ncbi:MAG: hypothetical protein K2X66_02920 [Cyanobacteria bacterium]|nr:hypothetical protein [Cyanobacteriota bacterium]
MESHVTINKEHWGRDPKFGASYFEASFRELPFQGIISTVLNQSQFQTQSLI